MTPLASAWAQITKDGALQPDYEDTASPETLRACVAILSQIREHIVASNDMRLFGLLHLQGQVSLVTHALGFGATAERLRHFHAGSGYELLQHNAVFKAKWRRYTRRSRAG
ncbi:MAG: hypothetical protein V4508_22960, partial [Pseudomonadota bacterium]